ncbi:hypothetical protein ACGH52_26325 [Streptomyces sp. BBFR25]|uniref:hypothetical protein n=1 Tax=Streptomyces sp. BBFR25 TaxID=3372855 RepID=UPI0037DD3CF0
MDSLVRVLASQAISGPGEDAESSRFIALWVAAEEPFVEAVTETYSKDPTLRAFEEASASGDVTPIIELAENRPPETIVDILHKLKERNWVNFAKGLLEGLAERLPPSRVPALASLLPPSSDDGWFPAEGRIFVGAFARVRPIFDVCQLADLMMRAGATGYAATLVRVVRDERSLAEIAGLLVSLHKRGHGWKVGNTWNSDDVWPASPSAVLLLIREFLSLGCPEGVSTLVARYGSGHSSKHRWDLYQLLGEKEMWDIREGLIQSLVELVAEREVAEFVTIAASAGDEELSSRVIRDLVSFRSWGNASNFIQLLPPELEAIATESRKRVEGGP